MQPLSDTHLDNLLLGLVNGPVVLILSSSENCRGMQSLSRSRSAPRLTVGLSMGCRYEGLEARFPCYAFWVGVVGRQCGEISMK